MVRFKRQKRMIKHFAGTGVQPPDILGRERGGKEYYKKARREELKEVISKHRFEQRGDVVDDAQDPDVLEELIDELEIRLVS